MVLNFRVGRRVAFKNLCELGLFKFNFLNFGVVTFPFDLSPINHLWFFGLLVIVNQSSLGDVASFVRVDDVVQKFITDNINVVNILNSFQLVSTVLQNSLLNKGKHHRQSLSLIRVILLVKSLFVGAEYLGQADWVTAKIVDKHVV